MWLLLRFVWSLVHSRGQLHGHVNSRTCQSRPVSDRAPRSPTAPPRGSSSRCADAARSASALYQRVALVEARRLECHFTPKHASWLNILAIGASARREARTRYEDRNRRRQRLRNGVPDDRVTRAASGSRRGRELDGSRGSARWRRARRDPLAAFGHRGHVSDGRVRHPLGRYRAAHARCRRRSGHRSDRSRASLTQRAEIAAWDRASRVQRSSRRSSGSARIASTN